MIWESPVAGVESLTAKLEDVKKRAQQIIDADLENTAEVEKRKLSAEMRMLDAEIIQLDSNVTNMGNIVRTSRRNESLH